MARNQADQIVSYMEHWGYDLFDKPHPQSPGYSSLVVAIRRTPTREHYDPERILLRSASDPRNPCRMALRFETRIQGEMQICPGQVELTDRVDKRLGFFVYGGTIETVSLPDETLFWLHSNAPILALARADEPLSEMNWPSRRKPYLPRCASPGRVMIAAFCAAWPRLIPSNCTLESLRRCSPSIPGRQACAMHSRRYTHCCVPNRSG